MDKDKDMSRRRFLKMAALTGAAMCVGPTLNKVTAAERVWMGKQQVANNIPAGMAAVRTRRTLGHGNTAFTVSAMGYGCMGLNHNRSQYRAGKKKSPWCMKLLNVGDPFRYSRKLRLPHQ